MTDTMKARSGRRIRGVQIAFHIIKTLQIEKEMGVTDLSKELGYSKSTVHSHLQTLEEERIVVQSDGGYRLSLKFLDIACHVRDQIGNYEIIKGEAEDLAEETGEVVQFGIEEYGNVTYLYKAAGKKAVKTASRVGKQQPIYSTALGKTILAHLPEERQEEIIDSIDFTAKTSNTITSSGELREDLTRIAERGYGIDNEENIKGLRCVAAPVLDNDFVLGAISISGPSSRITDERLHEKTSERVQRAANVIDLNTKFQ